MEVFLVVKNMNTIELASNRQQVFIQAAESVIGIGYTDRYSAHARKAVAIIGSNASLHCQPFDDNFQVVRAVAAGEIDFGVVSTRNIYGRADDTANSLTQFDKGDLRILAEIGLGKRDNDTALWIISSRGRTLVTGQDLTTVTYNPTREGLYSSYVRSLGLLAISGQLNDIYAPREGLVWATLNGHTQDSITPDLLNALGCICPDLKILGSYQSMQLQK